MVHMIQQGNQVGNTLAQPIENLGLHWLFITLLIVGVIQAARCSTCHVIFYAINFHD